MRQRDRGFSLVELLVVIGIIAVLVGVLLPTLSAARRHAHLVSCASNLRQINTAALLHAQEHQGYLPLAGELHAQTVWSYGADAFAVGLGDTLRRRYTYAIETTRDSIFVIVPLPAALASYMGHRDLPFNDWHKLDQDLNDMGFWRRFMCPASDAFAKARIGVGNDQTLAGQGTMLAFTVRGSPDAAWSTNSDYGLNEGLLGFHYDSKYAQRRLRGKLSKVRRSDQLVIFTDARPRPEPAYTWMRDGWICWTPSLIGSGPVTLADAYVPDGKARDKASFDESRHRGRINIAFADGHVAALRINPADLAKAYLLP